MTTDRYTHGHHESVLRSHTWRTVQNSAAYLLPHLRPGQRLLDAGCGPATLTVDLAARVAPGEVMGVDNAPDVLEVARRTVEDAGADNVTLDQADLYDLPFPDDSFDVVHAHQVCQHLSDPTAALRELRRVCRPGGVVAARDSDYPAMAWYPDDPLLDRWLEVYLAVARGNGAEPAAGRRLLSWAQAADFSEVIPSASAWCFATPERRGWWGSLWADRISRSALAEQAVEGGHAGRDELEAIAGAWRRWAAAEDGWYSSVHGEVLCRP